MSSDERQDTVMRAIEAGATDYLIKPVRRNELATLWQHVWRRSHSSSPALPSTQPESTAIATNQLPRMLGSPQQSTSGTMEGRSVNHTTSRFARSSAAAAESVLDKTDEPSGDREAASPRLPSDDSGAHDTTTQMETPGRQPPQACIAEPGTPTTLPIGLRELVAVAERHEKELRRTQGEDSGDAASFHHSATSSAFTSFATFVPRPCPRGDAQAARRAEAFELAQAAEADPAVRQTQEFVMAFQQAVNEHQVCVEQWGFPQCCFFMVYTVRHSNGWQSGRATARRQSTALGKSARRGPLTKRSDTKAASGLQTRDLGSRDSLSRQRWLQRTTPRLARIDQ